MKVINSKNNSYIKELFSLNSKKNIIEKKMYLIEGKNLIIEAIQQDIIINLLVLNEKMYSNYDVPRIIVSKDIIDKLSENKSNQGAIAVCKYAPLSVDLNLVSKIVVLENINNPGNFGTIIRTALAFEYDAIVTIGESTFAYHPKVIRSTQGALFKMPIMQVKSFINNLYDFKPYRFLLSSSSNNIEDVNFFNKDKYALVFGNESKGISKELKNKWKGEDIKININNSVESLNLSIAAGIAMYKFK